MKDVIKKSLTILLAVCLVVCGLPLSAVAADASGTCGDNLTWTLNGGTLTISGNGAMDKTIIANSSPWYDSRSQIQTAVIEQGVTSVGDFAFEDCSSLTSITIPDSVTSIGSYAFEDCSSLTSITIPDSVTSIGSYAFRLCSSLTSITIPDSVTSIGYGAFFLCSSLTSITIPDSVTRIEPSAFTYCTHLTNVTLPDSITYIPASAFSSCSSLESITIPDSVARIEAFAFWECSSLTSVTIPDSVTFIRDRAFGNCNELQDIYYSGSENQWSSISIAANNEDIFDSVTIHYNSNGPSSTPEPTKPPVSGSTITTESLQTVPDGVVDVPYQAIIETTLGENLTKSHELVIETGELPQGLLLEADGELHGIPSQAGEYEFTVALKGLNSQDIVDKRSYKVIVKESTPENVAEINTSSQGYRLLDPLPEVIDFDKVEAGAEFTFRSEGPFDQLAAVYIDGDELTPGVDYSASEGSCVIVLSEMGYGGRSPGRHVISATFKQPSTQGNFTIKKTAQAVSFVNPKPRPIPKYPVSLECSGGGAAVVSNKSAEAGKTVTITVKPNYGRELDQVTAGSAKVTKNGDKYTFTMPAAAVTVKVSFKRIGAAEGTDMPFFDVRTNDWFYEPVKVVYKAGLMKGTDSNAFAPNHPALREMIAVILYRHAGSPPVEGGCSFVDVKAGTYYEKAVIWAEQNGIISGTTSTKFSPSGKITRQELVTLIYRYAGRPAGSGELTNFTDIDKLSSWAEDAMAWAIENGIVAGKGNNRLDPQGNATRAEIATVLQRFMELYDSAEIELSTERLQMSVGEEQTIQLFVSKLGNCEIEWSMSAGDIIDIVPDGMSCKIEALNPGNATVYVKALDRTMQCVVEVEDLAEQDPDPDDGTDVTPPVEPDQITVFTVSVDNQNASFNEENGTQSLRVTIPHTTSINISCVPWDDCTGQFITKQGITCSVPSANLDLEEYATMVDSDSNSKTYQLHFQFVSQQTYELVREYPLYITVLK